MSGSSRLPSIRNLVHGSDSDSPPGRGDVRGQAGASSSTSRGSQRPTQRPIITAPTYAGSSSTSHQHRDDENKLARINLPVGERPREQKKLPSISEMLAPTPHRAAGQGSSGNVPSDSQPRRPASNGYPCERCGRLFSRKADAVKHIRVVHDRVKNFSCSVCGRMFGRKDYCTVSLESMGDQFRAYCFLMTPAAIWISINLSCFWIYSPWNVSIFYNVTT